MPKFWGTVGYIDYEQTKPGVWTEVATERTYGGDINRDTRVLQNGGQVNDNISVSNTISIVADAYANRNFHTIRYVIWNGAKWKVTNIDASQRPRLILTLGGLYNGKTT